MKTILTYRKKLLSFCQSTKQKTTKPKLFYFLLIMTLVSSCQSIKFKRPLGVKYLVSVERRPDGTLDAACLIDDERDDKPAWIEEIDSCNNVIGAKEDFLNVLEPWLQDKVMRLEICLNYPKKCQ